MIDIPQEHIGFYRAVTPTGWAAFSRKTGVTRPATAQEAARAEQMTALAAAPERPQEPEA
ncbi:hypothetical protein [Pseudooceanicola marinus]|uniref:hypothetical protein n=1 Tax=Pseudooceanicola marinus TaxID=396013 RepID=UPI001CD235DA|nr:hypothetical protein [Pseudooceanicola marinus]MCA1337376.1 hypothetical protein [Pseudooceanicola marinus]